MLLPTCDQALLQSLALVAVHRCSKPLAAVSIFKNVLARLLRRRPPSPGPRHSSMASQRRSPSARVCFAKMIATSERGFGYQASFLNPFVCCSLAKSASDFSFLQGPDSLYSFGRSRSLVTISYQMLNPSDLPVALSQCSANSRSISVMTGSSA
jgi:hypothetical protein